MNVLETYNHLKTLNATDIVEFLVSKVNVCDLQQLECFADFDAEHTGDNALAMKIFEVRVPS